MSLQPRLVEVRQNVLRQNDVVARELRQRFHDAGVFVVSARPPSRRRHEKTRPRMLLL